MPIFGTTTDCLSTAEFPNTIVGAVYTCNCTGRAEYIKVMLNKNYAGTVASNIRCAIYRHSDLALIAVTEEHYIVFTSTPTWYTFYFRNAPRLTNGVEYILAVWTFSTNITYGYNVGETTQFHTQSVAYNGDFPYKYNPSHDNYFISIYCNVLMGPTQPVATCLIFSGSTPILSVGKNYTNKLYTATITRSENAADTIEVEIPDTGSTGEAFLNIEPYYDVKIWMGYNSLVTGSTDPLVWA